MQIHSAQRSGKPGLRSNPPCNDQHPPLKCPVRLWLLSASGSPFALPSSFATCSLSSFWFLFSIFSFWVFILFWKERKQRGGRRWGGRGEGELRGWSPVRVRQSRHTRTWTRNRVDKWAPRVLGAAVKEMAKPGFCRLTYFARRGTEEDRDSVLRDDAYSIGAPPALSTPTVESTTTTTTTMHSHPLTHAGAVVAAVVGLNPPPLFQPFLVLLVGVLHPSISHGVLPSFLGAHIHTWTWVPTDTTAMKK